MIVMGSGRRILPGRQCPGCCLVLMTQHDARAVARVQHCRSTRVARCRGAWVNAAARATLGPPVAHPSPVAAHPTPHSAAVAAATRY